MNKQQPKTNFDVIDEWVADTQFRVEIPMSLPTMHRRDKDSRLKDLGWPEQIKFKTHPKAAGYRSRRKIEIFKQNLVKLALIERNKLFSGEASEESNEAAEAAE